MKNNLEYIPAPWKQKKINILGNGYVPCEVSNRWLQFDNEAFEDLVNVDVMTLDDDEKPRKICRLVLNTKDVLCAISSIKAP